MRLVELTNIGSLLAKRNLLRPRLNTAGLSPSAQSGFYSEVLAKLQTAGSVPVEQIQFGQADRQLLNDAGILQETILESDDLEVAGLTALQRYSYNPLENVDILNLVLTFVCNLNCRHCQQNGEDKTNGSGELSTEEVQKVIEEAQFANILGRGLNFTGGEPLLYRSDIFDLLHFARSRGILTRLNTNGWFGGRETRLLIGPRTFNSSLEVVHFLKDAGLTVLAVSLDGLEETHDTKRGSRGLFRRVLSLIQDCVNSGLLVHVLATGVPEGEKDALVEAVRATGLMILSDGLTIAGRKGQVPFGLDFKSTVDIGAAAANNLPGPATFSFSSEFFSEISRCSGKGLARPTVIHLAPDGGVRTCTFAEKMSNLGNVREDSFIDIINRFPGDGVSTMFVRQVFGKEEILVETARQIFRPNCFKQFSHSCAATAVIAKLIDAYLRQVSKTGAEPTEADIIVINRQVARDLNLLHETI
ncbi:hypothetical protein A3H38_01300 [candidate division WOR-1 bacterium RIFCSPLOWO2_02_FULL_46_20]|uniref:Radical SAM core domain-containing protein n=2 Tax=Saganbacteria TaxID=1703751 RepID=A0A1F4RFH2_UNCSA|nr:MAG: hypothetical protein A3J44_06345 [candidate division WOR-1 bacterium RIFCSPHIGHO2_02_FULL_45_12]OGC06954.1 MAG: hypothetical protein A3H38_01300 [candidate division WOR-1 bacterium RIFCSPLOWO2_02_FULL_46_20]OGC08284.1 MAG: hypothetical protein A3F86_05085 [candidate division WOR-1 bacterium RIFCSPLOWO2_12_FULL_45_9]